MYTSNIYLSKETTKHQHSKINYLSMRKKRHWLRTGGVTRNKNHLWYLIRHPSAIASPLNIFKGVFVPVGKVLPLYREYIGKKTMRAHRDNPAGCHQKSRTTWMTGSRTDIPSLLSTWACLFKKNRIIASIIFYLIQNFQRWWSERNPANAQGKQK